MAMSKVRAGIIGICLVLLGVIVACGEEATPIPTAALTATATPAATPTPSPTPVARAVPTGTLDVGMAELGAPAFVLKNMAYLPFLFDHLVTNEAMFATSPDGRLLPLLVKEWEVDSTGLIYTFNLQEGVPWQTQYGDWGEFDADDFIYTIKNINAPGNLHGSRGIRQVFFCGLSVEEIYGAPEAPPTSTPEPAPGEPTPFQHGARPLEQEGVCELTKIDDLTVQLVRPEPTYEITWHSRTPQGGTTAMHSKKHFDAVGEEVANTQSVGTSPWELYEVTNGVNRKMRAVQDHWRKTPEFAEMVWWEIAEESTRLANFLAGIVDTAALSADSIRGIKNENRLDIKFMNAPGLAVNRLNILGMNYLSDDPAHQPGPGGEAPIVPLGENTFDCTLPWVSCDRDLESEEWETARKVRLAMTLAIDRQKLVNNLAFGDGEPVYVIYWASNPARLVEFGLDQLKWDYDPARARELLAEAGYPDGIELDMFLASLTESALPPAEAVATMWEEVGIRSTLIRQPYSAFRPTIADRTAKGVEPYVSGPINEPIRYYGNFYSTETGFNFGFEHPWWQEKLVSIRPVVDDDERWAVQTEMARWMFDNVMTLPLFGQATVWPLGPEIDAWEMMGLNNEWLSNTEFIPHRQ